MTRWRWASGLSTAHETSSSRVLTAADLIPEPIHSLGGFSLCICLSRAFEDQTLRNIGLYCRGLALRSVRPLFSRLNPAAQKVRSSSLDISRPAQAENASVRAMQRSEGEAPVGRVRTATHMVADHYWNL